MPIIICNMNNDIFYKLLSDFFNSNKNFNLKHNFILFKIISKILKKKYDKENLISFWLFLMSFDNNTKTIYGLYIYKYIINKLINYFNNRIIKLVYYTYQNDLNHNHIHFFELKKHLNLIFKKINIVFELKSLFYIIEHKNSIMKNLTNKVQKIYKQLTDFNIDKNEKNMLLNKVKKINFKHQKVFYSRKYNNLLMHYQNNIILLDKYINNEFKILFFKNDNYDYLNIILKDIKYNFETQNNIFKLQVFNTFIYLNNFFRLMSMYGFKSLYTNKKHVISYENSKYVI